MKELYEFDRRISALERRDIGAGAADQAQGQAGALLADQVVARLDWLKEHADGTDEAGRMVLERLDDLVGKVEELARRVSAIESARRGGRNG
jgi:hypothetical protein